MNLSDHSIDQPAVLAAAQRLAQGALVAFPTETVYGLGARADDDAAVAQIFAAKGRPADHPLIVHVLDEAGASAFALDVPAVARRLMNAFWPGPLTVIVPRRPTVATACAAGQDSIGLRCPSHPAARALLQACRDLGVPGVAAPSANRFGRVSPTRAEHVRAEFGGGIPVLDGGPCQEGIESVIVDCTRGVPVLLRPGTLSRVALEAVAGQTLLDRDAAAPRASGTLASHYAPSSRVRLVQADALPAALDERAQRGRAGRALALYSAERLQLPEGDDGTCLVWRAMPADAATAARDLFAGLRELDEQVQALGGGEIWVVAPPEDPAWDGVRDRLMRAAAA
jgi:L-threonylcarbamoyladenylate synthase